MLVSLTYWSKAADNYEPLEIDSIKTCAEEFNKANGITGCLLLINGFFMQTLEGDADIVNSVYRKIVKDSRHYNIRLLNYTQIMKRHFMDWIFVVSISEDECLQDILMSYSSQMPFSLDDICPSSVDHLMNELYLTVKRKNIDAERRGQ